MYGLAVVSMTTRTAAQDQTTQERQGIADCATGAARDAATGRLTARDSMAVLQTRSASQLLPLPGSHRSSDFIVVLPTRQLTTTPFVDHQPRDPDQQSNLDQ